MKNLGRGFKVTVFGLLFIWSAGLSSVWAAEVTGVGNFTHIVADMDRSIEFYGDVLGLEVNTEVTPFSGNPAIMQLGNTIGAQSRMMSYSLPGSDMGIELVEYKDISRHPVQTRFQDPGAALVQLRVRDLDRILDRLESSQGYIWTPSGTPVSLGDTGRIIFLKDPDGFFVELIEVQPPAESADIGTNVYGASFELIINDTDDNAEFYREGLGLAPQLTEGFDDTPLLSNTVSTLGAAFRRSSLQITDTNVLMTFLEFKDINRKPMDSLVQDPGTAILQIKVDDVAAMTKRLIAAGGTVITQGGEPVVIVPGVVISIVRDPNNLFIELLPSSL